jgi:hypothetical protein
MPDRPSSELQHNAMDWKSRGFLGGACDAHAIFCGYHADHIDSGSNKKNLAPLLRTLTAQPLEASTQI